MSKAHRSFISMSNIIDQNCFESYILSAENFLPTKSVSIKLDYGNTLSRSCTTIPGLITMIKTYRVDNVPVTRLERFSPHQGWTRPKRVPWKPRGVLDCWLPNYRPYHPPEFWEGIVISGHW